MKGIILAGGSGTRLYPMTQVLSKQLFPVYDKPMIYYPLSTLMQFGIRDILIISTPRDLPNIQALLGNGSDLGLTLHYAEQPKPDGIAQAFVIGADFIGDEPVCLILGDNIFYMGDQIRMLQNQVSPDCGNQATIFAYHVNDPERFGVVAFDENHYATSIAEKPVHPKSNFVSVGLYFYPTDVVHLARSLKPSARGEFEITDLNNLYLTAGRLNVVPMGRGVAWLDAGTPDSLMEAGSFIRIIEKRQGLKIACLEEIAYRQGFISRDRLYALSQRLPTGDYKRYLTKVCGEVA